MYEFLDFQVMVSNTLLKIVYILGAIGITLASVTPMLEDGGDWVEGLIVLVIGNLVWRILCEGGILLFKIYEVMLGIDAKLAAGQMGTAPGRKPQTASSPTSQPKKSPARPLSSLTPLSKLRTCSQCGEAVPIGDRHCPLCGASIPQS